VPVTVRQDDEAIHAELGDQPPAELARQAAHDLEPSAAIRLLVI
jgi:hypothetical protein